MMTNIEKQVFDFICKHIKENSQKTIKCCEILVESDINISMASLSRCLASLERKGNIIVSNNGRYGLSFDLPKKQPDDDQVQRNLLKSVINEISIKDVRRYYDHFVRKYRLNGFPNA